MPIFRDDHRLLTAFRAGDREALRRVYDHYARKVEQVVRQGAFLHGGRFSGAPRAECRDLVQETFLRAFSAHARLGYNGLGDYEPFVLGIARHVLAEWWRRRGREIPEENVGEREATEPIVEEPFDARELAATQRYLETLPSDLKQVHAQRYVSGLSQVEAAAKLGLSRQNIRTLEARLRKGLKKFLQKHKNQPECGAHAREGIHEKNRTTPR
jgi:RNA polymerase sigma-70 factor (ECF subfamily)